MRNRIASYLFLLVSVTCFHVKAQSGTWVNLTSGTTHHLLDVSAVSDDTVYASGYAGTVLKTVNGGATWMPQVTGTLQNLYGICFTDADHGVAVGDNGVIRTTDGGATWTTIVLSSPSYRDVYFYDDSLGFIAAGISGQSGQLYRTTDGGANWNPVPIASGNVLRCVKFTSAMEGYTCDYDGAVFKTTDGGSTWNLQVSGTSHYLFGIDFTNATDGIIVGESCTIIKTTNGGNSWSPIIIANNDYMVSVKFYNSTNGFITGGNVANNTGTILSTADGGNTWSTYFPGCSRLFRVDFATPNAGYAVGLDGTILKYVNNVGIAEQVNTITVKPTPNPASGFATIDLSGFNKRCAFQLFDIAGKVIRKTENIITGKFVVEQTGLTGGMYFFTVMNEGKIVGAGKIIFE